MNYLYKLILLMCLVMNSARAQSSLPMLKPGDSIPDALIPKIIYSNKRFAKISDFNKQLLIIDFWATNCAGCVRALPKMERLQREFGNKVKILPVTEEKEDYVTNFWKNNKYTRNLKLSSVVEDKVLSMYFKHRSIPHEIWIYKGKVIAITEPEYVDANNIRKVLDGEEISWPIKYDYYVFDSSKPLFLPDSNQIDTSNTTMKYVAISGYREGVTSEGFSGAPGTIRNKSNNTIRTFFLNESIFGAYLFNWNHAVKLNTLVKPSYNIAPNQIIWDVSDKSRYTYIPTNGYRQDWLRLNGICFESQNPDTGQTDQQVARTIISDMNALLGLNVRWEKRKEKVFYLVGKGKQEKSPQKISNGKKYSISALVFELNQQPNNPYVFKESKSEEELFLNIHSWTDIQSIRKALQTYGYDLIDQEKDIDKFIFSEVDGGLLINGTKQREFKLRKELQKVLAPPLPRENMAFLENNKKQKGVVLLPSGLQYKVLKIGNGEKPTTESRVRVNYTGMLINGKVFESTDEGGKPLDFYINSVIKGWQEALPLMAEGSKWVLYIPAELAYGTHTQQGTLPPNSTLIFEIELLKILP